MTYMTLWYLQLHYQMSTESLWYLHIYGIYNFATRYLWISMASATLYDNYGLYQNFQSLLMSTYSQVVSGPANGPNEF